jgi:hypothetical protein
VALIEMLPSVDVTSPWKKVTPSLPAEEDDDELLTVIFPEPDLIEASA